MARRWPTALRFPRAARRGEATTRAAVPVPSGRRPAISLRLKVSAPRSRKPLPGTSGAQLPTRRLPPNFLFSPRQGAQLWARKGPRPDASAQLFFQIKLLKKELCRWTGGGRARARAPTQADEIPVHPTASPRCKATQILGPVHQNTGDAKCQKKPGSSLPLPKIISVLFQ